MILKSHSLNYSNIIQLVPKTNHKTIWFLNLNNYRTQTVCLLYTTKVSLTWYPHWKVFIYLLHKELKKVQSCSSYLILYMFLKICVFIKLTHCIFINSMLGSRIRRENPSADSTGKEKGWRTKRERERIRSLKHP